MINISDIDKTIYDWITQFSGIEVINLNYQGKNNPKPNLPFITFRRQSLLQIGQEFMSLPDTNGLVKISGDRELVVNLQAYGENAFGILEDLYHINYLPASQELLTTGNLFLINMLAITDLTGLNDTCYEERATMDLMFRFASQFEDVDVGLIENVEIEGTLKDPEKIFNIDIDLT